MADEQLFSVLVAIGSDVEQATEGFGAAPRSPLNRARLAIGYLRDKICPYRDEVLQRAKNREVELAVLMTDLFLFWIGNQVPGLPTLAKVLAEIGLEKFCADPNGTLGKLAGVQE